MAVIEVHELHKRYGDTVAGATGTVLFFPSAFLAGIYVPRGSFRPAAAHISDVTPLGAALEAVRDTRQGAWPHPVHLVTMVAWTLVAGIAAARTFRWE